MFRYIYIYLYIYMCAPAVDEINQGFLVTTPFGVEALYVLTHKKPSENDIKKKMQT